MKKKSIEKLNLNQLLTFKEESEASSNTEEEKLKVTCSHRCLRSFCI